MDTASYRYRRDGRNWATLIAVVVFYAALILAVVLVDASVLLMAALALFAVPALYDLWANPAAGLTIDASGLHWYAGRRTADLGWDEIDQIRLDTRLDFSVRVTAVLGGGRKIRLPTEATPPHKEFEAQLQQRHVPVVRHHFSLIG